MASGSLKKRGSLKLPSVRSELALPFFRISGATGAGVPELLEAMWRRLTAARQSAA